MVVFVYSMLIEFSATLSKFQTFLLNLLLSFIWVAMSYYKILSSKDNKQYHIEGLYDGIHREMRVQYADLVRIKESSCQI